MERWSDRARLGTDADRRVPPIGARAYVRAHHDGDLLTEHYDSGLDRVAKSHA
jgi:hypothetical protein